MYTLYVHSHTRMHLCMYISSTESGYIPRIHLTVSIPGTVLYCPIEPFGYVDQLPIQLAVSYHTRPYQPCCFPPSFSSFHLIFLSSVSSFLLFPVFLSFHLLAVPFPSSNSWVSHAFSLFFPGSWLSFFFWFLESLFVVLPIVIPSYTEIVPFFSLLHSSTRLGVLGSQPSPPDRWMI